MSHELKSFSSASQKACLMWSAGVLARLLHIRKRELQKAIKILKSKEMTDEVMVKDRVKEKTFYHGFRVFSLFIKNKQRKIQAPHPAVQKVLHAFKDILEAEPVHERAFGFVKGRGIVQAVKELEKDKHFFSFDISEAFPSIMEKMVESVLRDMGIPEYFCEILAWMSTYYFFGRRRLPQGASSSPILLNLVYRPMCEEIDKVCQEKNIKWFVYADDFSFAAQEISHDDKKSLLAIPTKYGFKIKEQKTRDNYGMTIPHLLGLTIVNGEIHLRRRTKKKFRRIFYSAWKYDSYTPAQIKGVVAHISQIYGEDENDWPSWLSRYYFLYKNKKGDLDEI